MAKRRHGGLGRGLDALIPQARPQQPEKEERRNTDSGNNVSGDKSLEEAGNNPEASVSAAEKDPVRISGGGAESSDSSAEGSYSAEGSASRTGMQETAAEDTGAVRVLRLSQIDPNRSQPRQNFEDESLEELADSIRQFGVLQPILVQKKGSRYEIIAGERRWRASRKAGLTEIPAIVREYTDQETLELSLIENIQREDLNPIEEAKAFRRLLDEFSLRQEDLAARDMIVQGEISMGHARALIPVEIQEEQYLIAQQVAEKHLSVRDVEKLIKERLSGKKKKKSSGKGKAPEMDAALELAYKEIEERLKQSLGTKTVIRHSGDGSGRLEIEFYSHEDLEKIVDMLT